MTTDKQETPDRKRKIRNAILITCYLLLACVMVVFFYDLLIVYPFLVIVAELVRWRIRSGVTRGYKIVLSLLLSIVLFFVFVAGVILSVYTDNNYFYPTYLLIYMILFVGWMVVWCFRSRPSRKLNYILVFFLATAALLPIGYEQYQKHLESIPRLSESFSLTKYRPFTGSAFLARLEEEATLQLSDSLPVVDGATALYPLYAAFVEATYPQELDYDSLSFLVRGGTTPEAYRDLIAGEADVVFCAQPSPGQWEDVKEKGDTFLMTPIGKEAFVFFVNRENPVTSLSLQQIRDIFSGKITNWKEVGGNNGEILAFQRPAGSGSQTMLEHIMGDTPLMPALQDNEVMGMGEIIDLTSTYHNRQNALGYSFLFFTQSMVANNNIRLLKIEEAEPTTENIRNNSYPFIGDFYAITLSNPSQNTQRLIEWTVSPQGQELVEKTGYVPLYHR